MGLHDIALFRIPKIMREVWQRPMTLQRWDLDYRESGFFVGVNMKG